VHDDILDFTQSGDVLGKPAFNDLKEGIVTSPIIYALSQAENDRQQEEWHAAITRKFQ